MRTTSLANLMLVLTLAGCEGDKDPANDAGATAELQPLAGSGVSGTVTFTEKAGKIVVEAEITGLTPGLHGFHIHEFGVCTEPDGMSAGGHFNPGGHDHGPPGSTSHPGDLGNLEADADGRATLSLEVEQITLDTGTYGILGRGLIVHADPDDLVSQPVGMAGGRVACAMIAATTGATTPVTMPPETPGT